MEEMMPDVFAMVDRRGNSDRIKGERVEQCCRLLMAWLWVYRLSVSDSPHASIAGGVEDIRAIIIRTGAVDFPYRC